MNIYYYSIYGMNIESELECPDLLPGRTDKAPDVFIRFGKVPAELPIPKFVGRQFEATPDRLLFKTASIANYLVSDGKEVIIDWHDRATDEEVRLVLLGTICGALLHQRGAFPLHGSAISLGDGCAVFCGEGGSGKSTLLREFLNQGYEFLDDNLSAVMPDDKTGYKVMPGSAEIKLWEDALEKFGYDRNKYRPIRAGRGKYALYYHDHFCSEPLPLKKIYLLSYSHEAASVDISPVEGIERFYALRDNTFCGRFLRGMKKDLTNFRFLSILGESVPINRIRMPVTRYDPKKLCSIIEKDLTAHDV